MKQSLSLKLLIKVSLIILISIFTLGFLSVKAVKSHSRASYIKEGAEYVNTLQTFVANTNSVMMQQLRSYTMLDDALHDSHNAEEIQKILKRKSSRRGKWFINIAYVDYATALCYYDTGFTEDVSRSPWFVTMKSQRKQNKGLQLYGDVLNYSRSNAYYPICKDAEPKDEDGFCYGFYVGFTSLGYMHYYFQKIKGKDLNAPEGYPLLINKERQILYTPDAEAILQKRFIKGPELFIDENIDNFLANPAEKDLEGNKITVSGAIIRDGKSFLLTCGMLSGTPWTLAIVIPDSTINEPGEVLAKSLIKFGIFVLVFMLVSIFIIFKFSFEPLTMLNDAFRNIAAGDADLTKRLKEGKNDEIGQIQRSFNEYITSLQQMIKDIGKARENLVEVSSSLDHSMRKTSKEIEDINLTTKKTSNIIDLLRVELRQVSDSETSISNSLKISKNGIIEIAKLTQDIFKETDNVQVKAKSKELIKTLKVIDSEVKDAFIRIRASENNSVGQISVELSSSLAQLERSSSELRFVQNELNSLVKSSYESVNMISERVEGFKY